MERDKALSIAMVEMPPQVHEVYEALRDELERTRLKLSYYTELYSTSSLRHEMLDAAAAGFFLVMQEVLFDELHLSVSKLSDKKKSTLTLQSLLKRIRKSGEMQLAKNLDVEIERMTNEEGADHVETYRNKRLAHYDLQKTLDKSVLQHAPRLDHIRTRFDHIERCLEMVFRHYRQQPPPPVDWRIGGGADQLVKLMKMGLHFEALMQIEDEVERGRAVHDHQIVRWWEA
ncbi:hypothetical protein DFR29_13212 [Tahibacter aquaticus]|uniref:HEPN AbiU2-like domain-containing protein n=1 Tax=Tahibacter aquaticus TaxID=520092 RepID=A0A4R6YHI9_9GAMM|nr:hypothetical protein [Tahibacter aquaticus]TDR36057.1 hypothetical protein DFR29_13212 [Tahibacter aquaticus]